MPLSSSSTPTGPAHTYFTACIGAWRAPLEVQITDRAALRAGLGWLDAVSLRALAAWPAWAGPLEVHTTVAEREAPGVFEHTTRFVTGRLELLRTREAIEIRADGASFELTGEARSLGPAGPRAITGAGRVDPDTRHAHYELDWMGSPLTQHTARDGDTVTLRWRGAGYVGVQRLRRVSI